MRQMRVMHILSDFEIGGAQQAVLDMVSNLDRARFRAQVCCLRGGGSLAARLEERQIPHHIVCFANRVSPIGLYRLRQLLREQEIDIVHTHLRRANLSGRLAALLARVPVRIAHLHDMHGYKKRLHRRLHAWLAPRTDRFLACSEAVARSAVREEPLLEERVTVFYNFLVPAAYRSSLSPELAKAELGIPVESPCVGIVGRLHPVKRHDLFLEAALELNNRRPDVHFAIIGEGSLREALREKTQRLGMTHRVTFAGRSHEVARVYRALDVLVLCSDSEGLGKVILEAQAAGVPVVARAVGGVPEALAGGGGLLVEEASKESLANAMAEALKPATTRLLRSQMPGNLQRFDAARQMTVLEDLYEELYQRKGLM